jgi:uncharacterized protein YggE
VLDLAVSAGGNTIENIQFVVSDPSEALAAARSEAVADARQKAEQLAGLAGTGLGSILEIIESPSPRLPAPIAAGVQGTAQEVPIEPGTQTVQLDLQVTWLLSNAASNGTVSSSARLTISPARGTPGSFVLVHGEGFPTQSAISLTIGRSNSDQIDAGTTEADAGGSFSARIAIPSTAEVNERWFVIATVGEGSQQTQSISNMVTITGP